MRVEVSGGKELGAALDRLGWRVARAALVDVVKDGLEPIYAATDAATPAGKTGNLKRYNKKQIYESTDTKVEGEVINTARHAHLVEYGHALPNGGTVPGVGFMRRGFDTGRDAAEARVRAGLKRLVDGAA